jgi:hypothetical protein
MEVMIVELIIMLVSGGIFLVLGWRIWKKEQITLIHSYHYTKVSQTDKKFYTEKMGKGIIVIGIGMIATGIFEFLTSTSYGWIFFGIGFVWGFTIIILAQKKYNGGLF